MERRGSHTSDMLNHGAKAVQNGHHVDGPRRLSDPTTGVFHVPQQGALQLHPVGPAPGQAQNFPSGAPPTQVVRSHTVGQHHSFASSMDLMTPHGMSVPHHQGQASSSSSNNNHLFQLSSHHTSYSAAAGDLLTMSRRPFDPSQQQQQQHEQKKRSASNDNGISMNTTFNYGNPPMGRQLFGGNANHPHQQQQRRPGNSYRGWQSMDMGMPQNAHVFNIQTYPHPGPAPVSTDGSISTNETMGGTGDMEESYQHHRTIRRCRRSDSFEMMDA